jgi:hypothetical protein
MNKQVELGVTVKFRGYFASRLLNGAWQLRGRGERRTVTHTELQGLLNARPKRKGGAR